VWLPDDSAVRKPDGHCALADHPVQAGYSVLAGSAQVGSVQVGSVVPLPDDHCALVPRSEDSRPGARCQVVLLGPVREWAEPVAPEEPS